MNNPNDWDAKQDLQKLIEKMRDRGMHDNPRLREARQCLAAEMARRKGDRRTFNHIVSLGDYGGGGC